MRKKILQILAFVFAASSVAGLAQAPKDGVYISDADVKAVLKRAVDTKRTNPDNAIRVIDMGNYQLSVSVIHRGAMGGGAPANANAAGGNAGAGAAAANPAPVCGQQRPGASGPSGILHDDTAETYIVTSGSATLVTGGTIVNGRRSAADNEVTTILNGPSCSGTMVGYTSREVKSGDIIVIPEGVPHGFSAIPDQVTYLSIRPDLKKVLQHGYVHPAVQKYDWTRARRGPKNEKLRIVHDPTDSRGLHMAGCRSNRRNA
jgi:mannose-6-phosphate isomerase-like protein (cupin superfamily)